MDLGIDGLGYATEIGAGASAIVYKARQVDLDREVAVKVLSVTDDAFVRRFKREAKTLGKLSQNPGIVTVYDTGVNGQGHPYLILELCQASLLDQVRSSGVFKPREACMAMDEVALAVAAAHENGVVHRDIKPGNVLVSSTGRYMVTDFGISTVTGATMGQTNSVGFTAGYVAPETLTGEDAGPPADVYALGATLFHMVAGKAPFVDPEKSSNLLALAQRVINDPVPDLRGEGIEDDVCRVIEATMAKDPADRPTSLQMATYLQAIVDGKSPIIEAAAVETNAASASDETQAVAVAEAATTEPADTTATDLTVTPSGEIPAADTGANEALVHATSLVDHPMPSVPGPSLPEPSVLDSAVPPPPDAGNSSGATSGLFESASSATTIHATNGGASGKQEILSSTPSIGGPGSFSGDDRRYRFTQDDRRGLGPLIVGAVVGLIVLVAFAGYLILRDSGDGADVASGDNENTEVVAGPDIEPNQNESSSQSQSGNTGSLIDGQDSSTTIDRTTTSTGLQIPIPSVVGETAAAAGVELRDSGFTVNRVDEESASVAVGIVIRQDPASGRAESGGVVTIFVSAEKAKETVAVPTLAGLTKAEAEAKLAVLDLLSKTTTAASATVAKGIVISSSPGLATTVTIGSTVTLIVSDGSSVPRCSDLVGLTEASATDQLSAGGLTVSSTTVASDDVPIGHVISCTQTATSATLVISSGHSDPCSGVPGTTLTQATAALELVGLTVVDQAVTGSSVPNGDVISCSVTGSTATLKWSASSLPTTCASTIGTLATTATTNLEELGLTVVSTPVPSATVEEGIVVSCSVSGSTATMTVSSGADKVVVPELTGLTEAAAKAALISAGLSAGTTTSVDSELPVGTVISSTPAEGSSVDPDTIVSLRVSSGPAMATVPNVVGLAEATATALITNAGLTPITTATPVLATSPHAGKVISQSLASASLVAPGSSVTIAVGVPTP